MQTPNFVEIRLLEWRYYMNKDAATKLPGAHIYIKRT
jgi:hypothetical protein